MPPRHPEIVEDVLRALETYLRYVRPNALGLYADEEGYWQDLDSAGWNLILRKLRDSGCPLVTLHESCPTGSRYAFHYQGRDPEFLERTYRPDAMCEATFWLPTEYLEEHGPGRVRELALELASLLPLVSGSCGLAFIGELHAVGMPRQLVPHWMRYPGIDIPEAANPDRIGTRLRGPHWMNFLGQPVLGELGGASGLRARLTSPGTTVEELPGDKGVITLGPWPEAGDTERGDVLPAYRELARVFEPWLYQTKVAMLQRPMAETRRWERRFLD
ncbi:MAG TPA: type VI immunity family protein [Myxococcaceae bacterium]